jgi:3-oxoacyl-[acyl-carrier protein] reductase
MEKKVALVTGGSRGIGRAICLEFAREKYHVIINFKSNTAAAEETLAAIKALGADGELCPFDVADTQASSEAISAVIARHHQISALINNAGVVADGLFPMMSPDSWRTVLSTTLDGFYNVTKPVLKAMIRKRAGVIIAISSVSGIMGNRGQVNYSAAKAGIIGACKALSKEVARLNIRVNVVAPGLIETEMIQDAPAEMIKQMIPMNRFGKPEEVSRVVRFLCSDDASYITGQVIGVNGGMI